MLLAVRRMGLLYGILALLASCTKTTEPPVPDVTLIVLDTLRADHTSVCGYDRPTTPTLERLVGDDWQLSCTAVSPGDWTLPSHASFFTGLAVVEHGAVIASSGASITPKIVVSPLAPSFTTLAEQFRDQGYATVGLSANPVVSETAGLGQGFDAFQSGPVGKLRRGGAARRLKNMLPTDGRPVFTFVNLFDAHDPYPAVPEGLDWAPAQPKMPLHVHTGSEDESRPERRFLRGEMSQEDAAAFLTKVTNGYDFGVYAADDGLAAVLRVLKEQGLLEPHDRVVITSDHGEFLGEKGFLRHAGYVWEPNVRVPLLTNLPVELPDNLSGLVVYDLLRTGKLPAELPTPQVISFPNPKVSLMPGEAQAAQWRGPQKTVWTSGETVTYDLPSDPSEGKPGNPAWDLNDLVEARSALLSGSEDADMTRKLQELGYMGTE